MGLFGQIDLMGRGGSIALLLLWSWILIREHGQELSARLAVLMNLSITCYLLVTTGWQRNPSGLGLVLALGAGATPGLFWLFAKAWFNDEKVVSRTGIILVLVSVLNTLIMQLSFSEYAIANAVSGTIFRIAMLCFAGAAFWEVWRSREGDLVEERRKIRPRLVAAVATCVVLIAFAEVIAHSGIAASFGLPEHAVVRIVGSPIIFITFAFCAAMLGMRQSELFAAPINNLKSNSSSTRDDPLVPKLLDFMKLNLPYRDETLSIARLAIQLDEQEYRLRRTINGQLGHRNFASFLNGYRLAEVKAALADPTQRQVPIITIALDAGFGSLGPFNRAFREAEGMTPSRFRALHSG
jgi:AraC-like DNA-binding protein